MNPNLIGSYHVLAVLPIWATALILYMMTIGVIFVLRDRYEGLFYNTSYSAMLGDGALIGVVLMAAEILKRGVVSLPEFPQSVYFHICFALVGGVLGCFWWLRISHPQQWGDVYHHLVIVPLVVYLGLTLLPVIYYNGTRMEVIATICLIALWAGLVVYDLRSGRLDQRKYHNLRSHLKVIQESIMWKYFKSKGWEVD